MLLNVQQQKFHAHSGREQVTQYLQKIFGIKGGKGQILQSLPEFFHLLARKSKLENFLFIHTNSFIIFTCPNPVLLVPGFRQLG
jgi:hypothetical protein